MLDCLLNSLTWRWIPVFWVRAGELFAIRRITILLCTNCLILISVSDMRPAAIHFALAQKFENNQSNSSYFCFSQFKKILFHLILDPSKAYLKRKKDGKCFLDPFFFLIPPLNFYFFFFFVTVLFYFMNFKYLLHPTFKNFMYLIFFYFLCISLPHWSPFPSPPYLHRLCQRLLQLKGYFDNQLLHLGLF